MGRPNGRNRHVRANNRGTPERHLGRSLVGSRSRSGTVHKVPTSHSMWSGAAHYSGAAYRAIRNITCGATQYTLFVLGTPFRLALKLKQLTWNIPSFTRKSSDIENQVGESHENCTQGLTQSQRKAHQHQIERLQKALRNEKDEFQKEIQALKKKLDEESREKARMRAENEANFMDFQRLEAQNLELDKRCQQWEKESQDLDAHHQREIDGFQRRYGYLRDKLEAERKTNQELSIRLSKVMSNKLTDNNPNIADLSDENRPTKLVEKLSELYDNEWTNAYGVLEDQYAGYGVVCILLNIFQDCFNQCRNLATEQLMSAKDHIMNFSPDDAKQFKDERRRNVFMTLPFVTHLLKIFFEKKLSKELPPDLLQSNGMLQDYIHRCTEVSWLMAIQDPPMAISTDIPRTLIFNKSYFKEYTKSGQFVDYVVWPAILIQDGGALMAKGIVQCCDRFEDSKLSVKELA